MNLNSAKIVFTGRKHSLLWLTGFCYIVIGLTWIITGVFSNPNPAFYWLYPYIGIFSEPEYLGWIWIVSGFIQTLPMILPKVRKGKFDSPLAFGFGTGILVPAIWSAIYMTSGLYGYPYGAQYGVVFLCLSIIVWEISGWEEPSASISISEYVKAIKEESDAGPE